MDPDSKTVLDSLTWCEPPPKKNPGSARETLHPKLNTNSSDEHCRIFINLTFRTVCYSIYIFKSDLK